MNIINWFLITLVAVMATNVCAARDVYVSADAAANGDGTQRTPFQTLTEARDFLRAARLANEPNSNDTVTVHIGNGVYRSTITFITMDCFSARMHRESESMVAGKSCVITVFTTRLTTPCCTAATNTCSN